MLGESTRQLRPNLASSFPSAKYPSQGYLARQGSNENVPGRPAPEFSAQGNPTRERSLFSQIVMHSFAIPLTKTEMDKQEFLNSYAHLRQKISPTRFAIFTAPGNNQCSFPNSFFTSLPISLATSPSAAVLFSLIGLSLDGNMRKLPISRS